MQNSSKREPTVAIVEWISAGRKIHRKHNPPFFTASLLAVGTIGVCLWLLQGASEILVITLFGPFHAGLCYMGLKAMRGQSPRIRDMFIGFKRYWEISLIWLVFPVGVAMISASGGGALLFVPLLWAMGMLVIPLFIDRELSVKTAISAAFDTVFTRKNWWRFWLFGMGLFCLSYIGIAVCVIGVCYTLPFSICAQMIAYNEIFRDNEKVFETVAPSGNQRLLSQIIQHRNKILTAIDSANEGTKSLLESSIEQIGGVVSKAVDLVSRLDQIEEYLKAASEQSLRREKDEIDAKIAATSNSSVVIQYQEVLKALNERLANHKQMKDLAAKIRAQLTTIRISLDNTLAKIIQIKTVDVNIASLERDGFSRDLQSLRDEMEVLLESLNEMERSSR